MNQALVQDVVAEVMRRLNAPAGGRPSSGGGTRAGEDAAANEPSFAAPHRSGEPTGQFGVFNTVDEAVVAATEAQKKLAKLSLDDRDAIVELIKAMAKQNAQAWGQMEFDETKIGRLDHK